MCSDKVVLKKPDFLQFISINPQFVAQCSIFDLEFYKIERPKIASSRTLVYSRKTGTFRLFPYQSTLRVSFRPQTEQTPTTMLWQKASSICSRQNASEEKLTKHAKMPVRTCSITSNYSTIQNVGMLITGCCHPLNMRWQQNEVTRCL